MEFYCKAVCWWVGPCFVSLLHGLMDANAIQSPIDEHVVQTHHALNSTGLIFSPLKSELKVLLKTFTDRRKSSVPSSVSEFIFKVWCSLLLWFKLQGGQERLSKKTRDPFKATKDLIYVQIIINPCSHGAVLFALIVINTQWGNPAVLKGVMALVWGHQTGF